MLQTRIAKGNDIELLQASCTAITRYLLALSCKCCSSRRFPFQLVQVLGPRGGEGVEKKGLLKACFFKHAFCTHFCRKWSEKASILEPIWPPKTDLDSTQKHVQTHVAKNLEKAGPDKAGNRQK